MDSLSRLCSVEGCKGRHAAKGFCRTHYSRAKKYGSPDGFAQPRQKAPICTVQGCDKPPKGKGLCHGHYARLRRYGSPEGAPVYDWPRTPICIIEDCGRPTVGRGLCNRHWLRRKYWGDPRGGGRPLELHGMRGTPEYRVWKAMTSRCYNQNGKCYRNYGGRGIKVCDRWRNGFIAFFEDMGIRPGSEYSIDRKDNDGSYSCGKCAECIAKEWPANCKWATRIEQNLNQRLKSTNRSGYRGVSLWQGKWAARLRVDTKAIHIGYYADPAEAAWMFDQFALQLRGELAKTNFDYYPVS